MPKAKVLDLATCAFVDRRENVLLVGQTGVGKSHIAQALGHRACMAGHLVLYTSAHQMLGQLRALKHDEPMDLYEVISQRYERGSIVVTSNRAIEEWSPLFGDQLLAGAAMDRLLHHGHLVAIEGDSYRNPSKHHRRKQPTTSAEA